MVECVGAVAKFHPAAFIAKLIPRLKKEMFTGKKTKKQAKYQNEVFVTKNGPLTVGPFFVFLDVH